MSRSKIPYSEFTRSELYELLWSRPRKSVAEQLGVRDGVLTKECERANIPIPSFRHWSLSTSDQNRLRPALPPRPPGMFDIVRFGDWSPLYERTLREPHFVESIEDFQNRITVEVKKLLPPSQLKGFSNKIARIMERDERRDEKVKGWAHQGLANLYGSQLNNDIGRRWLKILEYLLRASEQFGGSLSIRGEAADDVTLRIGSAEFLLRFRKFISGSTPDPRQSSASSLLEVVDRHGPFLRQTKWKDIHSDMDKRVPNVFVDLLVQAEELVRDVTQRNYENALADRIRAAKERERAEIENRRRELREAEERKQAEVRGLLEQAQAFRQAQEIRAFIDAALSHLEETEGRRLWADWATEVARQLDPLTSDTNPLVGPRRRGSIKD